MSDGQLKNDSVAVTVLQPASVQPADYDDGAATDDGDDDVGDDGDDDDDDGGGGGGSGVDVHVHVGVDDVECGKCGNCGMWMRTAI